MAFSRAITTWRDFFDKLVYLLYFPQNDSCICLSSLFCEVKPNRLLHRGSIFLYHGVWCFFIMPSVDIHVAIPQRQRYPQRQRIALSLQGKQCSVLSTHYNVMAQFLKQWPNISLLHRVINGSEPVQFWGNVIIRWSWKWR